MTTMELTEAQTDGRACVACGAEDGRMVPVGSHADGTQIFACSSGGCVALVQILYGAEAVSGA